MDKTKPGARPEIEVRSVSRVMYVGADGVEYDTADEARWSFIRRLLVDILDENNDIRDFDLGEAADGLRKRKDDVIAWLRQV